MFFGTVSVPSLLCVLLVGPLGFSDATNYEVEWIVENYDDVEATVGDSVTFRYNVPNHNLYIHPTGSCSEDGKIIVGEDSGGEFCVNVSFCLSLPYGCGWILCQWTKT